MVSIIYSAVEVFLNMVNNIIGGGRRRGFVPVVAPKGNPPVCVVLPAISGTLSTGNTLTATTGTWTSVAGTIYYRYQWQRNSTDIVGENNPTYVVRNADLGGYVTCLITAANTDGVVSRISNQIRINTVASLIALIGMNPNTQSYEYNSKFYANYWHYADSYEYQDNLGNWSPLPDSYLITNDGWPNSAPSNDPSGKYTFRKLFTPSPTPNTTLNVTWTGNIVSCGTGGSASGFTSTGAHSATFVNIPGMAGNDISPPAGGSTAAWAYFWYQITPGDPSYGKNIFIAAPGITFAEPTYVSDVGAMTSGPIRMLNPSNVNGNLGVDPGAPGQTGNSNVFPAAKVTAANRNTPLGGNWVPDSPGNAFNGTPHGHDGWPIEVQFGIAHALNRDLWTCLQANGDNTYYDYIATWIRDYETTVQPGQTTTQPWPTGAKIYLQLTNETWNNAFAYWHQANEEGLRRTAGKTISSITFVGTTATVTTATAHGLTSTDVITVDNAVPTAYNVHGAAITVTGANTFTYTMGSTPASNATTVGVYASAIKTVSGVGAGDGDAARYRTAQRAAEIFARFESILNAAGKMNRIVRVFDFQLGNTGTNNSYVDDMMNYNTGVVSPITGGSLGSDHCDMITMSAYFDASRSDPTNLTQAFVDLANGIDTTINLWISFKAKATSYGKKVGAYEGGDGTGDFAWASNRAQLRAFRADPRMQTWVAYFLQQWTSKIGSDAPMCWYADYQFEGGGECWNTKDYQNGPESPTSQALKNFQLGKLSLIPLQYSTLQISQGQANGTSLGVPPSRATTGSVFSLADNSGGKLAINSATGELTLADTTLLTTPGNFSATVRETNASAVNSPNDTVVSFTVSASTASLYDDFNDNTTNASKWTVGNFFATSALSQAGTVAETTGQVVVTPVQGSGGLNGYISVNAASFVGKYVFVERKSLQNLSDTMGFLRIGADSTHGYTVDWEAGNIYLFGDNGSKTNLGSIVDADAGVNDPPTSYVAIRLSHDNTLDKINVDTAPSWQGPWTNRISVARSDTYWPQATSVKVGFGAGHWGGNTGVNQAHFDNFDTSMAI